SAVADMVGGVHRAVLAFGAGGAPTAVGAAGVSSRVHHVGTELEGGAVAVEALHSGAEDAALAGEQSARMCGDLAAEVEQGAAVLARVVESVEAMGAQRERIERLAEQLAEIATFSGVIKEVADKTKLLALNATIEAARAGTHGAAFGRGRLRAAAPVLDGLVRGPRGRSRPSPGGRDRRRPRGPRRQRSRLPRTGPRPALRRDHRSADRRAAAPLRRLARAAQRLRP